MVQLFTLDVLIVIDERSLDKQWKQKNLLMLEKHLIRKVMSPTPLCFMIPSKESNKNADTCLLNATITMNETI